MPCVQQRSLANSHRRRCVHVSSAWPRLVCKLQLLELRSVADCFVSDRQRATSSIYDDTYLLSARQTETASIDSLSRIRNVASSIVVEPVYRHSDCYIEQLINLCTIDNNRRLLRKSSLKHIYLSLRQKKSLYKQNRKVTEQKQKKTNAYYKYGLFMTVNRIYKMHVYVTRSIWVKRKTARCILYSQINSSTNVQTAPIVHVWHSIWKYELNFAVPRCQHNFLVYVDLSAVSRLTHASHATHATQGSKHASQEK